MSEFQKDELSLEETNKLRIQLGLKPLTADSDDDEPKSRKEEDEEDDPLKNQDEKAAKNYEEHQTSLRKKKEEEEVKERIAKAKNKIELNKRLEGSTLGQQEASSSTISTKKWLKEQRKKAIANEERRRQEEQEAEAAAASTFLNTKYDTEDLQGLKVGHDVEEFDLEEGGEGRILTLRDRKVLDEEDEDELMDMNLDQKERDRINEERKKGIKEYNGLDDEEFQAKNVGKSRGVLSKYDADLYGDDGVPPQRDIDAGFRLGGNGDIKTRKDREEEKRKESQRTLNRTLLNLDYTKNEEMSDYLKEGDVGFKKPKTKKKKRQTARIRLDEDDENDQGHQREPDTEMRDIDASSMQNDKPVMRQRDGGEIDLIDDEDLALSLAKARRKQAKKAFQKTTPEMIAKNLAEQKAAEEAEQREQQQAPSGQTNEDAAGLVFDDTSEFVRNLQAAREASPETKPYTSSNGVKEEVKSEERQAMQMGEGIDATEMLVEMPKVKEEISDEEDVASPTPVEETVEPLISGGLGSTLSLLRNQGLLTETTAEQKEREKQQKEYDAWLATRRAQDRAREAELAASKAQGSAKDQATREYENRMRELEDARKAQERFKDYKPDFEIKYHDEFGRELNNHEAWKRLSHTFHGKAPGKKKQEQRLQKIENEKKRERMLAGDNLSGMTKAFVDRAERSGQAHMVLSVGAKNNAPQDIGGMLAPNTYSKGKSKQQNPSPITTDIAPGYGGDSGSGYQSIPVENGITSMVPRSTTVKSKAGFTPISAGQVRSSLSASMAVSSTSNDHPSNNNVQANASKFKLAFGKRPAPNSPSTFPNKQLKEM